jgi:hypothetical protein
MAYSGRFGSELPAKSLLFFFLLSLGLGALIDTVNEQFHNEIMPSLEREVDQRGRRNERSHALSGVGGGARFVDTVSKRACLRILRGDFSMSGN